MMTWKYRSKETSLVLMQQRLISRKLGGKEGLKYFINYFFKAGDWIINPLAFHSWVSTLISLSPAFTIS